MIDYYQEVLHKVQSKTVNIDLLISPPRTGSTIMGRILARAGGYDDYINEPGARFTSKGDDRVQDTYKIIYDRITRSLNNRNHASQPIQILIKDIAQHYGPEDELEALERITQGKIAVLIRTPVTALESMTLMMCELAEIMKGKKEHVLDYVSPGTDLSHIDFTSRIKSSWQQHIEYMKAYRDYSSLGTGFKKWWLECNPMFNTPSLRYDTWKNLQRTIPDHARISLITQYGFSGWQEFMNYYVHRPMHEMPPLLSSPFEFRHGGLGYYADSYTENGPVKYSLSYL